MRKFIYSIFFLLFILNQSYSKPICYLDTLSFRSIEFTDASNIDFWDDELKQKDAIWNNSFKYRVTAIDGIEYLNIYLNNISKKFLMLKSDSILVLYDTENPSFNFCGVCGFSGEFLSFPTEIKASSELHENSRIYSAQNIANLNLDSPWVEAAKGNGIGQSITFGCNASGLYFLSGYVSAKKPNLWKQNSRPKRIQINFLDTHNSKVFLLKDSPDPQFLNWGQPYNGFLQIVILEVYKGTKHEDTCINSIILRYL